MQNKVYSFERLNEAVAEERHQIFRRERLLASLSLEAVKLANVARRI